MKEAGGGNGRTIYDWENTDWAKWPAPKTFTTLVRFGELQVDLKSNHRSISADDGVAGGVFGGGESGVSAAVASLLIHADREGRPGGDFGWLADDDVTIAHEACCRGGVKFTIIDPVRSGQGFSRWVYASGGSR